MFKTIIEKFNLSSGASNLFGNLFWAILGKISNLLSGLIVGIIIARYLGPEQYGLMNYVISYVFLFQVFASFGLDSIETREEARRPEQKDTIIGSAFFIKIVIGIITIALCVGSSCLVESDMSVVLLVLLYSSTIVINSAQVIRNYFFSIIQNEYVVKTEIFSTIIGIFLKLLLLYIHADLVWFILVCVIDPIVVAIGYSYAYTRKVASVFQWKVNMQEVRYLMKESFPLLMTNAAVIIYQRIDTVMIGQMIDKESVGYFSVASRFVEILIYIPMVLAQTITPILVKSRERNREEYHRRAQHFMDLSVWSSLFASVLMALIAYPLITILFGMEYLPAVIVLQVMSFKAVSVALSNTAGALLVTEGLQKFAILRDGFGCIVCIVLNMLLLPKLGIVGAAITAIASNIAAGYIADILIPQYRHLFRMQTATILYGWRSLTPNILRSILTR